MTTANLPFRVFLRASYAILIGSGLFAIYLGITGRFLPHDEHFLGMTARELCALHGCRIVHFMVHDRVSFGGAVLAVGLLYLWMVESPLRKGQSWAWWSLLLSGMIGFTSFLSYLGFGYLDLGHGLVTLGLLLCFVIGLAGTYRQLKTRESVACLVRPSVRWPLFSYAGFGRVCLLASAAGLIVGGFTILVVGMTCVFVPQDLSFMGLSVDEMDRLNPRLVPLIAHDRAGFGGAVCSCGIALFLGVWRGEPSRALWIILVLVGAAGFGTAIGVHPAVGYTDAVHLAPAVAGAVLYGTGLALSFSAQGKSSGRSAIAHGPGSYASSLLLRFANVAENAGRHTNSRAGQP